MNVTSYGTWSTRVDGSNGSFRDAVITPLGSYGDDYDVDGLTVAYRDAINAALPDGVTLAGDQILGPHPEAEQDFSAYPRDEDGRLDVAALVETVDFWALASKFDRTNG